MNRKSAVIVMLAVVAVLGSMVIPVFAQDDMKDAPGCRHCGMDRQKFDFSRMVIHYEDGSSTGVCSLRCAAVELATNIDKTPSAIMAADFDTKTLIDAEKAFWVLGGSKPGVMSKRGKWAFEKKESAEAFIKANGGTATSFDDAIKAAYTDLYEDTKMIREKRKMMKHGQMMEHKH